MKSVSRLSLITFIVFLVGHFGVFAVANAKTGEIIDEELKTPPAVAPHETMPTYPSRE